MNRLYDSDVKPGGTGVIEKLCDEKRAITDEITALKKFGSKFRNSCKTPRDIFFSVDASTGNIIACDSAISEITGYRKEEIVGRPILTMYQRESIELLTIKWFPILLETGQIFNAGLKLQMKNGGAVDVLLNVSAVRDQSGRRTSYRSVWRILRGRISLNK